MNPLLSFPAHLITGPHATTEPQIIEWLQQALTHCHGCKDCAACNAIKEKNFYACTWIVPENKYTLELLETITHKIKLQLTTNEHHFFVITRAELLTAACANTLLKIVEEPPVGYHFIFIAPHKKMVLPTIVSRCVETSCNSGASSTAPSHPLVAQALLPEQDWAIIYKEISSYTLTENETLLLFEYLLMTFTELYKEKMIDSTVGSFSLATLETLQDCCKNILNQPLQPGSSKIIWKDFFIYKTLIVQ